MSLAHAWTSNHIPFLLDLSFQTYGFEHVYKTLSPLETAGLLRLQTSRSYNVLRKSLKLVVEDVQEQVQFNFAHLVCYSDLRRMGILAWQRLWLASLHTAVHVG